MPQLLHQIKDLIKSYEAWVAANPEKVSDVETTTKCASYFIARRVSNSNVLFEFVYSLSNLLVLYNDRIIERSREGSVSALTAADKSSACHRLKVILTTLEYSEVFIEVSTRRAFGKRGKWFCIVCLQLAKAAARFYILRNSKEQIISTPALPSIGRNRTKPQGAVEAIENRGPSTFEETNFTLKLKRSGRILRKVEGAPPMQFPINFGHQLGHAAKPKVLMYAEYLYIAKPLVHLVSMGLFGERQWRQYAVALCMDLFSIRVYHKHRHMMTKAEKLELSRRCLNLLLYLMRSPLYDVFTKRRLEGFLDFVADKVPLAKLVARPVRDYIPYLQDTYYYLWAT